MGTFTWSLGAQASGIPFLLGKDRAKAAVATLVATEQGVNLIASVASFGPERPGGFPPLAVIARDVQAGFRFVMAASSA